MTELHVNPTRMELKRLKARRITARRGHKLLKDKRDELMKQFLDVIRAAKNLRDSLCDRFTDAANSFTESAAENDMRMLCEAFMIPSAGGSLTVSQKNIMSVTVPQYRYETASASVGPGYGFAFTSEAMDDAVNAVSETAAELIRLAELEKTAELLCAEIERTRRRVNALEYSMIPQYEAAIKRIAMKLDENERSNQTRLMKVKDMMLTAQLQSVSGENEETE